MDTPMMGETKGSIKTKAEKAAMAIPRGSLPGRSEKAPHMAASGHESEDFGEESGEHQCLEIFCHG
jgi:hypothetical protein